jgi:hypothetical protein
MSRYQFIWWGWREASIFCLPRRPDPDMTNMALIYEWWGFCLGPLEVRKWVKRTSPIDK